MNTTVKKSCILIAVLLLCIGAVIAFIYTIVKPPIISAQSNRVIDYEKNISAEIQKLSSNQDEAALEKTYQKITDMLSYYSQEGCIDKASKKKITSDFLSKYIPLYSRHCYEKFKLSVWNENELKAMNIRSGSLLDSDPSMSMRDELLNIQSVINNYYDAKKLLADTYYNNIKTNKQRISKAKEFKNKAYIRNCSMIKQGLDNYPSTLEAKHFAYALNIIKSMNYNTANSGDNHYSCSEFREQFVVPARNAINEYGQAKELYGKDNQNKLNSEFEKLWDLATAPFHYDEDCLD